MMAKSLSQRTDFPYFIGAGISLILFFIAVFLYNNAGAQMIFPLVSFFTYSGVLIRGILEPGSWGRSPHKRKISSLFGLISVFVIFSIETVLLLTKNFNLSEEALLKFLIIGGIGLLLLFIFLYTSWFRKLTYDI
jgi:hypothetical protein